MQELKDAGVDVSPERLQPIMKGEGKGIFGGEEDGDKGGKKE